MASLCCAFMRWSYYLSLRDAKLKPGMEWSHEHSGWCFLRIAEGNGYWLEKQSPRELAPGDVLILPPGTEGNFRASLLSPVRLQFFLWKAEAIGRFLTSSEQDFFSSQERRTVRCFAAPSDFARQFEKVTTTAESQVNFALCVQLLSLVSDAFTPELAQYTAPGGGQASVADRFKTIMGGVTDSELMCAGVEDLARRCGCSLRHFSRLFQETYGTSLRERQTALRLEKASQLLLKTDAKVLNVAMECGYRNLGLFNFMFKKNMGMTPTQWREEHRAKELAGLGRAGEM